MKPYLILSLVIALTPVVALSQSAENELYEKLIKGSNRVAALETVLKTPDRFSALILYMSANVAFRTNRLEDSAFLFYAGQLRARFDMECFPPRGTGGNHPFVLYDALSHQLGSVINPAVMTQPKVFSRAIARVKKWSPKAPEEYHPGYEFMKRLSEKEAHKAAKPNRDEFISRMSDLASLLNDPEYFSAFRVIQTSNLAFDDKRPTREDVAKATEAMKRIEKEKRLKGVFTDEPTVSERLRQDSTRHRQ
jgi:hypothetical protein